MSKSSNRLRAFVVMTSWLPLTLAGAAFARADPELPPLPPAPFPVLGIPGSVPPASAALGNPPIAPTPPASSIDARGINISTNATVQQGDAMPGARLGAPLSGVGVLGPGMDAGVSVGATGTTDSSATRPPPRQPPIGVIQNPFLVAH